MRFSFLSFVVATNLACFEPSARPSDSIAHIVLPDWPGNTLQHEAVLFGFDRQAFPFQANVQIHLTHGENPTIAVRPGPPGSHDEFIRFYGTVLHFDGAYHLWYFGEYGPELTLIGLGQGGREDKMGPGAPRIPLLCYARSRDGITWEKPKLGLVAFAGSRDNNIVDLPNTAPIIPAAAILHDPEDPNPERRFKLAYEARYEGQPRFCIAYSADGLHWKPSSRNPVGPFLEMAGIAKFNGLYYVTGQDGLVHRPFKARMLATFASADFETWSPVAAAGLARNNDQSGPSTEADINQIEEIHLGAALWNRGNLLLGVYGQWHGHPTGDRRLVSIDLGLALSHDALTYEEPIAGFRLIPAREQPESANEVPALMQGQGFENIGDRTFFWYSTWRGNDRAGVRVVSWEKDRLGYLQPFGTGPAQIISTRIAVKEGAPVQVSINASGLSSKTQLRVSLVDEGFRPIVGFGGADACILMQNDFAVPVQWKVGSSLPENLSAVRVMIEFVGTQPEAGRLHALYLHGRTP